MFKQAIAQPEYELAVCNFSGTAVEFLSRYAKRDKIVWKRLRPMVYIAGKGAAHIQVSTRSLAVLPLAESRSGRDVVCELVTYSSLVERQIPCGTKWLGNRTTTELVQLPDV